MFDRLEPVKLKLGEIKGDLKCSATGQVIPLIPACIKKKSKSNHLLKSPNQSPRHTHNQQNMCCGVFNYVKVCYISLCCGLLLELCKGMLHLLCICLNMKRCVTVSPCLPKAPIGLVKSRVANS